MFFFSPIISCTRSVQTRAWEYTTGLNGYWKNALHDDARRARGWGLMARVWNFEKKNYKSFLRKTLVPYGFGVMVHRGFNGGIEWPMRSGRLVRSGLKAEHRRSSASVKPCLQFASGPFSRRFSKKNSKHIRQTSRYRYDILDSVVFIRIVSIRT